MSFWTRYKAGVAALAGMAAALGVPMTNPPMNAGDMGVLLPAGRGQRKAKKPGDRKGFRRRTNRGHAKQRAKLRRGA